MSKKQILIGTSGHIDHGKTSLIKALTGIDTDNLKEEKKRGITIETGIAHWDDFIPDTQITFLDVPGHEKLVKNMVSGVQSIDLFMLIVAADDGVMPQTREHMDILNLLGIREGLVVITKADLVEADWLEMVQEEVTELGVEQFGKPVKVISVDSLSGTGLTELKQELQELILNCRKHQWPDNFSMPVDKIFPVPGYGHIFRGTVEGGELKTNEKVQLYPSDLVGRVRYIQTHKSEVDSVQAGDRAGVNISDIKMEQVPHEPLLARPGSLVTSRFWWLSVNTLPDIKRPIKHMDQVHFLQGTRHLIGKLRLYDEKMMVHSRETTLLLELEEAHPFLLGDRFIIRQFSPAITIAGGAVLSPARQVIRKKQYARMRDVLNQLSAPVNTVSQIVHLLLQQYEPQPLTLDFLSRLIGLKRKALQMQVKNEKQLTAISDTVISNEISEKFMKELIAFADSYFEKHPTSGEFALSLFNNKRLEKSELNLYISLFKNKIKFIIENEMVYPSELKPELQHQIASILKWLQQLPGWLFTSDAVREKLEVNKNENIHFMNQLEKLGHIKNAGSGNWILTENFNRLTEMTRAFFAKKEELTVGDFKEMINSSRKEAIPLLELLDNEDITVRDENVRRAGQ